MDSLNSIPCSLRKDDELCDIIPSSYNMRGLICYFVVPFLLLLLNIVVNATFSISNLLIVFRVYSSNHFHFRWRRTHSVSCVPSIGRGTHCAWFTTKQNGVHWNELNQNIYRYLYISYMCIYEVGPSEYCALRPLLVCLCMHIAARKLSAAFSFVKLQNQN